jgi:hypothetical protein
MRPGRAVLRRAKAAAQRCSGMQAASSRFRLRFGHYGIWMGLLAGFACPISRMQASRSIATGEPTSRQRQLQPCFGLRNPSRERHFKTLRLQSGLHELTTHQPEPIPVRRKGAEVQSAFKTWRSALSPVKLLASDCVGPRSRPLPHGCLVHHESADSRPAVAAADGDLQCVAAPAF